MDTAVARIANACSRWPRVAAAIAMVASASLFSYGSSMEWAMDTAVVRIANACSRWPRVAAAIAMVASAALLSDGSSME